MKKILYTAIVLLVFVVESKAQTQINNFGPVNIIGGIGQILMITGSGFGNQQDTNFISFIQETGNYLDSSQARHLKYISWSNSKIEVEMPCAFSGRIHLNIGGKDYESNDTLKVKANLGYRNANPLDYTYLTKHNNAGGYTWYIHRTFWENPEAKSAIEDVFKEFRCKTGVNYILAGEPSDSLILDDNINVIAPDPSLNAAGYMNLLWSSCILGPTTFYQAQTMDISLSPKLDWYYGKGKVPGGKAKFRYVLMHELGHSVGLGHVSELGQTMYPIVTLQPADIWNERDSITTEEQTAMTHYVKLSQDFTFNACGLSPLNPISDCENVYGITSVNEIGGNGEQFNISPNPNFGRFKIESAANSTNIVNLEIFNLFGEKILERTNFNLLNINEINVAEYPKGIYFLKINNGGQNHIEKIVIQ